MSTGFLHHPPHGGSLVSLQAGPERIPELKRECPNLPGIGLSIRQARNLELLSTGAYSPLRGFMGRGAAESVARRMRLCDGALWPVPIVLDVAEEKAQGLAPGSRAALRDPEGFFIAVLTVAEVFAPEGEGWGPDLPGPGPVCLGGTLETLGLSPRWAFQDLWRTPAEVRGLLAQKGWQGVLGCLVRGPLHRAWIEAARLAAARAEAGLLIQYAAGNPASGHAHVHIRCCRLAVEEGLPGLALLGLVPPLPGKGLRNALLSAIVQKNYGATHVLTDKGRISGDQDSFKVFSGYLNELGLGLEVREKMVFVPSRDAFVPKEDVPAGETGEPFSESDLAESLEKGRPVPEWFSHAPVIRELARAFPPLPRRGFTLFFTGFSGAGKSTLARLLHARFLETDERPVTLLDGDIVRRHLSSRLGFSRQDRNLNVERIGFVASEITKNRGIAICAPIAPYGEARRRVRRAVEAHGAFVEVHVSTPLAVCEERDPKGRYAQARAGLLSGFTGVDDPYETPENPEVVIDTTGLEPDEAADRVVSYLKNRGVLP